MDILQAIGKIGMSVALFDTLMPILTVITPFPEINSFQTKPNSKFGGRVGIGADRITFTVEKCQKELSNRRL
jgi:hypothetical protein